VSKKGFAEGWHKAIDFEYLVGTENLSEKTHFAGPLPHREKLHTSRKDLSILAKTAAAFENTSIAL